MDMLEPKLFSFVGCGWELEMGIQCGSEAEWIMVVCIHHFACILWCGVG